MKEEIKITNAKQPRRRARKHELVGGAPVALFPPIRDPRIEAAPLMAPLLPEVLPHLPMLFQQDDGLKELLELLRRYLKDPSEIFTGPRSTGTRAEVVKKRKERCTTESCPLKRAKLTFNVWDWSGWDCDISAFLTLTWSYDECNIYDADASLTLQRNDCDDAGAFIIERYSIPETDPVEPGPCKPCTPKCLRAKISIIFYAVDVGSVHGIHRKIDLDIELCPSSPPQCPPKINDLTDYTQNRGDNGATPDKEQQPNTETWGIKKKEGPVNF